MATTVKSTDLDFQNIKAGLKNYLKAQTEFADYDFEASGLNNILDVLAYNTHVNGLTANFALNEAFLPTAQLRSSVVSHAETLGYQVRSRTTAVALVGLTVNLSGVPGRPAQIQLPNGWQFNTSIDGTSYTFRTLETYFARDNGSGLYQFLTSTGSSDIPIYEGVERTKTFLSGETDERQVFVIPDNTIDTATASVLVYDTSSSTNYVTYTKLSEAVNIDAESAVYTIREAPNGYYELNFGDGISFGKKPDPGNKVVVTYLSSAGPDANAGDVFTSTSNLTVDGIGYSVNCATSNESTGGAFRQSIESVRQLAPIAYAAQQRLVTSLDYKGIILSNFSEVSDCNVWSGDQNVPIDYGAVYVSLNFPVNTSQATKDLVQANIVSNFTDNLSVVSMTTKFVDPTNVYLELNTQFDFDPAQTGFTLTGTETSVFNYISRYFNANLNTFNKIFRRSNLLTEIDALDQAILSSRIDVKVQLRFEPSPGVTDNFELAFPMKIASPDDEIYSVSSSIFQFNGVVAQIKNQLNSTRLQIIDIDGNILLDNVGEYEPLTGKVKIIGFALGAFIGGDTFIKISVVPDNPSVIKPLRNYVIRLDSTESSATAIIDRQTSSLQVT
jgi:hypothetical protein